MRKTIFVRYFIRSVVLLMVSMLALSASFVLGASRILGAQQRVKMIEVADQVGDYIRMSARFSLEGTPTLLFSGDMKSALPLMAAIGDMHILICDADGVILLDSAATGIRGSGDSLPARVIERIQSSSGTVSLPVYLMQDMVSDAAQTIARPFILDPSLSVPGYNGEALGYVLISSYQNSTRLLMNEFLRNWSLMSVIIVLLSGITAYVSARRQVRPLRQMASCAHCFGRGDFSARADVEELADGEIRELAQAFNGMADALGRGEELRRGFIANVSHELKTPMTTISGFIGGILDGTISEEKRDDTLAIVRDEVMRLSRLVESTANLSRLQTGQLELHPRPFDIAELSLRVLLGLEGRINEKGLAVNLDVPETDTLFVQADPDSITQVLTNLLDNAVKFSEPGSELRLSIRSASGKVRVSVTNHGAAIPQDDLPYIFDRFYKADRSRSRDRTGLGLGLFLVRSIINAHNEDITVTSEDGCTEFAFTLTESKGR